MNKTYLPNDRRVLTLRPSVPIASAAHLATLVGLLLGVHQTASAAVITFKQVPTGTLSTYVESGFATSAVSGPWVVSTSYGNPAPFINFTNEAGQNPLTAAIQVTSSGSMFTFSSVDLYSSVTPIPYMITGFLNSAAVFSLEGTVPNTFGDFRTVVNSNSNDLIDSLTISLTNPAPTCCSNPMGLDNIAVTPVTPVPEPSGSLLFFWLGLPVFMWLRRSDA